MRRLITACAALFLAPHAPFASAQTSDFVRLQPDPGAGSNLRLGASALSVPVYAGSDERRTLALPLVDAQWRSGWFAGTGNGIGFNFSNNRAYDLGVRAGLDLGRESDRALRLRGFEDIDPALELGAFANLHLGAGFSLLSALRFGSGRERGASVASLGAGWRTRLGGRTSLGITGSAHFASADYMQLYHGVTPAQSAASGLPVYAPGRGLQSARLSVNLATQIAPRWQVGGFVSQIRLLDDAKNSPLTLKTNQSAGALFVSYQFD